MNKKRTILFSIILIPFLLVIPINISMIYNATNSINNAKTEILNDNYSMISHYVTLLEQDMVQVENYMNLLVNQDHSYLLLSSPSFDDDNDRFYQVQSQLIEEFRSYLTMNSNVKCIAAFFEGTDTYIMRDNMSTFEKFDRDTLAFLKYSVSDSEHNLGKTNKWHYLEIEKKLYLILLSENKHASCMIVLCLDDVLEELEKLDFTDFSEYFFSIGKERYKVLGEVLRGDFYEEENVYDYEIPVYDLDLKLGGVIYKQRLDKKVPGISKGFLVLSIIACSVAPVISIVFYYLVERPLTLLNSGMEEVRQGHTEYRVPVKKKKLQSEFDELNIHFNDMLDELEGTKLKLYTEEIDRQKVQLRYLNQQVQPHFILNALNIIYTYEDDAFPIAKKMVINLVKYFRYLVNLKSDYMPLWEEMEYTDNYLRIQKVRYPKRFTYFVEWEESLRYAKIPTVIIQTFVENSIKYGFQNGKSMYLFVLAKKNEDGNIKVLIADTGKGFEPEKLRDINEYIETRKDKGNLGIGIQNVVDRLAILYGNSFELKIFNADDGGARVEIILPLILDDKESRDD